MGLFKKSRNDKPDVLDYPLVESSELSPSSLPPLPKAHSTARLAGTNATPLAIAEAELAAQSVLPEKDEASESIEEPQPRLLESFDLKGRIQEAYKSCEIKLSGEVMEALKGFYTDHYELADMIGVACGDEISEEELLAILEREDGVVERSHFDEFSKSYQYLSFPAAPSAESGVRLLAHLKLKEIQAKTEEEKKEARDTILRCASACLEETLFQETSLGITTLEPKDLDLIEALFNKIVGASNGTSAQPAQSYHDGSTIEWPINNKTNWHRARNPKYIVEDIQRKKENFWDDCRMAGQLEIHDTGHLPLITSRGNILLPRTEQYRRYGTMHVQTAAGERMHSVVPHFSERIDPSSGYKIAGTHHKYKTDETDKGGGSILIPLADIIRVAPYARDAHYGIVEQKDPERILVSPPNSDHITNIGVGQPDREGHHGPDRVFFASSRVEDGPDSYEIKLGATSTILFIGDDIPKATGYGQGYGFPVLDYAETPGDASHKVRATQQRTLEHPTYKGKLIVPLRRHVFNFIPENMYTVYNTVGRKGALYNINPILQEV
jgi:hypothetical protein